MALFINGKSPSDLFVDGEQILQVYIGEELIYDVGERPAFVFAPRMQATAGAAEPTLFAGQVVLAPPMTATVDLVEPLSVTAGARLTPAAMTATAAAATPGVAVPATVNAPVITSEATLNEQIVVEELSTDTVLSPRMVATAAMPTPAVNAVVVLHVPPMTASVDSFLPTVGGAAQVASPAASATGVVNVPSSVTAGARIAPTPLSASADLPVPAVRAGQTQSVPAMLATAGFAVPTTTVVSSTIEDDILRAGPGLGSNWTTIGFAPVINNSNKVQGGTDGPSNATTIYAARHNTPLTTASQEVSIVITYPAPIANYATTLRGGGFLRADAATGNRVCFGGTDRSAYISTVIGGVRTDRLVVNHSQSNGVSLIMGSTIGCRAIGNVYQLIIDGVPTEFTWTDSGNLISQSNRYFGMEVAATKNAFGQTTYGLGVAKVRARDYDGVNEINHSGTWVQPGYGTRNGYSGFGPYVGNPSQLHVGVDIVNATNTPIYAACAGTVVNAGTLPTTFQNGGLGVTIDHGENTTTEYAHMNSVATTVGATVAAGQVIGYMGQTGDTNTTHMHFQVLRTAMGKAWDSPHTGQPVWVDPERWLRYMGVTLNWPVDPF